MYICTAGYKSNGMDDSTRTQHFDYCDCVTVLMMALSSYRPNGTHLSWQQQQPLITITRNAYLQIIMHACINGQKKERFSKKKTWREENKINF